MLLHSLKIITKWIMELEWIGCYETRIKVGDCGLLEQDGKVFPSRRILETNSHLCQCWGMIFICYVWGKALLLVHFASWTKVNTQGLKWKLFRPSFGNKYCEIYFFKGLYHLSNYVIHLKHIWIMHIYRMSFF